MQHITRAMAAAVINTLPSPFDAHQVERRLLREHTIAVAQEFITFGHTGDPLHRWSAHAAQWVDQQFAGQIQKTRKVVSQNLGGQENENQEWEKVNPAQPVV